MKRVLLSLWVIGAVLYAGSTLLFTNAVDLFGRGDDPKPIANDMAPSSPLVPKSLVSVFC